MISRQCSPKRPLPLYFIMSLFALWAFGCGGGGGSSSGSNPNPGVPSISTQGALDFGTVIIPDSPTRILTIKNDGDADLAVGKIAFQNAGTPFEIAADDCSNKSVAPSGTCKVSIQLTTDAASLQDDFSNTLNIPSNDNANSTVKLAVSGKVRKFLVSINEILKESCSSGILRLLVSVTDNLGPVAGLSDSNFTVYENDPNLAAPKTITAPVNLETRDIAVALLLDYSTSILDTVPIETAAKGFIDQLKSTDQASVTKFGRTLQPASFAWEYASPTGKTALNNTIDQPFTGDKNGTILYDAVFAAVNAVNNPTIRPRAVIVMSDGEDQGSTKTLDAAIANAISKGIPVFTIGTTIASDPKPEVMKRLADETGGTYFEVTANVDFQEAYLQIAEVLSAQYLIEYQTASGGGDIVSLDVVVTQGVDTGDATRDATGCP